MPTPEALFWAIVFGAIGMASFVNGKRQSSWVPMALGIALMGFPYLVSETIPLFLIGTVLTVAAYRFR